MNYREGVKAFACLLEQDTADGAGLLLVGNIRLYRNNCRLNRINALANTFTTVEALTGADFFAEMARQYCEMIPASSANLHAMGGDFADFIEHFEPAFVLPYLAEVAHLDWAIWQGFWADDVPGLDATALQGLSVGALEQLRLEWVPALRWVESARWPIADILAMHQGGGEAQLDAGGQCVLVLRNHWFQLEPVRLRFYRLLEDGMSVGEVLAVVGDVRAGEWLGWLFAHGVVAKMTTHKGVGP